MGCLVTLALFAGRSGSAADKGEGDCTKATEFDRSLIRIFVGKREAFSYGLRLAGFYKAEKKRAVTEGGKVGGRGGGVSALVHGERR